MADQLFAFTFDATADFRAPLYGQLDRIGTAISSYHKLEEASGNRVDVIPSGITLTDTNTVGQATGVVGDCADFTRANSEELVGSSSDHDFDGAADFAILIWASVDDNTGAGSNVQGPAVSKWTNSDRGWMLVYDQFADEWQFALSSDGTAVTAVGGGTFISTDRKSVV